MIYRRFSRHQLPTEDFPTRRHEFISRACAALILNLVSHETRKYLGVLHCTESRRPITEITNFPEHLFAYTAEIILTDEIAMSVVNK